MQNIVEISVVVPEDSIGSLYAYVANLHIAQKQPIAPEPTIAPEPATTSEPATVEPAPVDPVLEPETPAAQGVEVDASGTPFNPEIHTGTKKKDGTWRLKKGATETPSSTSTASPANPVAAGVTEPAGSTPTEAPASVAASQDEDDEFAAFRNAVAKTESEDATAAAAVPPRIYTDADLGALCNQAAVKLNDPAPIKELIARFVPEGQVAHSRNIPAEARAEFVKAVEDKAGIEFAE